MYISQIRTSWFKRLVCPHFFSDFQKKKRALGWQVFFKYKLQNYSLKTIKMNCLWD